MKKLLLFSLLCGRAFADISIIGSPVTARASQGNVSCTFSASADGAWLDVSCRFAEATPFNLHSPNSLPTNKFASEEYFSGDDSVRYVVLPGFAGSKASLVVITRRKGETTGTSGAITL